ncbi:hypothetical protein [Rummeliibacillus sp. TYF-LIM-RU47]|uniref:hypothetical protein n=1 Tax=Rummeliibacillus sp. TYF-LIM-RU47 TaxID=2608406 RepID=UPI001239FB10|nr:hypothetical protein [Rummeliibacillus sp. TYF-LIM-RU47]
MSGRKERKYQSRVRNWKIGIFLVIEAGWFIMFREWFDAWRHKGWLYAALYTALFAIGCFYINEKLSPLKDERKEEKFNKKYPFIKDLEEEQNFTIYMKNGKVIENASLMVHISMEIIVVTNLTFGELESEVHTIKLKHIESVSF